MDENKRKHLEFIQNAITRMSSNSFFIKGWAVTLVSALFALATKDADARYVLVTYFAIPVMWLLDSFYLSQERQYRALYDAARATATTDYSMDGTVYASGRCSLRASAFSLTLLLMYGFMLAVAIIAMFLLQPKPK